ncbi:hypothetical protein DTW90_30185 [Neorhizobium sp. P12A]|uniref:hypothetical protein n=1 Tax=Neorhizobium sp. P12A TaxID=2268027 RepID=UPI0011F069B9|nr:hypothetical protein [Neorhizobium sp. P12A]KAA0690238.1 hypothetical protein DTW90_30185 [Neorhizobium sp. P12A]
MSKEKQKIVIPTGESRGIVCRLEDVTAGSGEVAKTTAIIIAMPFGIRPRRAHNDPSKDDAEVDSGVADCIRQALSRPLGK